MTSITHSQKPDIVSELAQLKATARNHTEISTWFNEHLDLFGIDHKTAGSRADVVLNYALVDVLSSDYEEWPCLTMEVDITVKYNHSENPELDNLLGVVSVVESERTRVFNMEMPFEEWPLLTSSLAVGTLQDIMFLDSSELEIMHDILTRFIPLHFPGMTWPALQAMHAADLFPSDKTLHADITALLFERRQNKSTFELPESSYTP